MDDKNASRDGLPNDPRPAPEEPSSGFGEHHGVAIPPKMEDEALERQLTASLERMFPRRRLPADLLQQVRGLAEKHQPVEAHPWNSVRVWLTSLSAAAVTLIAVSIWSTSSHRPIVPAFTPSPVASLYKQAIDRGFEPYYHCEDNERFTATFVERLGVPVRLLEMPPGRRMLGLSYPGGMSRNTTAMLCLIDGEPVMVFVDLAEKDWAGVGHASRDGIQVFRETRDSLVFYEVTPLSESHASAYLTIP